MKRFVFFTALFFTLFLSAHAQASNLTAPSIYINIQGYDSVLCEGEVNAFTMMEAIQKLSVYNGELDIVFSQHSGYSNIYAINSVENSHFGGSDGWNGYILRDGEIITRDDYLSIPLKNGDMAIIYYGDESTTKILTNFTHTFADGVITFYASAVYTEWEESGGLWTDKVKEQAMEGINIHLILPGGTHKILVTDASGNAGTNITAAGVYKYYAEGYVSGSYPKIVRSIDKCFVYGIENENAVTRAEAAAYIVNHFNISRGEISGNIVDITSESRYYEEILTAVSAGIIHGYEDGSFRGYETVTNLQLAIMLAQVQRIEIPKRNISPENELAELPDWAREHVIKAVDMNYFNVGSTDWYSDATARTLMDVYKAKNNFTIQ